MTHPHLEGLIRKLGEIAQRVEDARRNGLTEYLNGREHVELRKIATELEWMDAKSKARDAALAALPGGGVDEAMVERAAAVFYGDRWPGVDTPSYRGHVRAALTAALPTPNPHEADRNG